MALTINAASSSVAAAFAADSATTQKSSSTNSLETPSKEMFLQLLVAQIKNQDPLNPTDGTQFLSQLAQFSELEQLIGIRESVETLQPTAAAGAASTDPTAQ